MTAALARAVRSGYDAVMHTTTAPTFTLTKFRADEVEHLLTTRTDTIEQDPTASLILWGEYDARTRTLTVLDATEAVEELRYCADWHEQEGLAADEQMKGLAAARSLRTLADTIEASAR